MPIFADSKKFPILKRSPWGGGIMSTNGKVLVAMSGGIDSTVTALMLHEQGYEVVGITMKTWDYTGQRRIEKETGCCNLDSFNDARMAAVQHGFPHYIWTSVRSFGSFVVENFCR
jgi:tRNA-specific 2-thiouridylase